MTQIADQSRISEPADGIDWDKIEHFVGFGPPTAAVVFLGMEEGLLDESSLPADLQFRSTYTPYEDLFEAQGDLEGVSRYFGANPKNQPTWRPMCHFMLRLRGIANPTKQQRLRYMADELGRKNGQTLLTELMPYPRKRIGEGWPYAKYGFFSSYADYRAKMLPERLRLLDLILTAHPRTFIICYGKADWDNFELLFRDVAWRSVANLQLGTWRAATLALAPHFATRAFNTDEQLNEFADTLIAYATEQESQSRGNSREVTLEMVP